MLKCIYPTRAAKLGAIAATYRAGTQSLYSSCPATCPLLPKPKEGSLVVDHTYLETELNAVPRRGLAWSYTHFPPHLVPHNETGTVLNISTDTPEDAIGSIAAGYPTVLAASVGDIRWPRRIHGTRFIRCPAETNRNVTCQSCGGGQPLCARRNRDYVIVFVAHGTMKKAVGTEQAGGCYAAYGPCSTAWRKTQHGIGPTTWSNPDDPQRLPHWANSLPSGTLLRHRVAGDIGLIKDVP